LNYDLTPTQALLLFGLLARQGTCTQAELMPKVKKADREALEGQKLIAVNKSGRGFSLTLTDAGWAWAAKNLSCSGPTPVSFRRQSRCDLLAGSTIQSDQEPRLINMG
jgi:hypothetical protein